VLFPDPLPKPPFSWEEAVAQFQRNCRIAGCLEAKDGLPLHFLSGLLVRPAVWIAGIQRRLCLPVLAIYPPGYAEFLRKIVPLRALVVIAESASGVLGCREEAHRSAPSRSAKLPALDGRCLCF